MLNAILTNQGRDAKDRLSRIEIRTTLRSCMRMDQANLNPIRYNAVERISGRAIRSCLE